jgi:ElaB/YqjD/DUF883 family membrane-anchored ribosome-binding protein
MSRISTPTMSEPIAELGDRAAARADEALLSTKRMAENTARSVQASLDGLRDTVPGAISRAAAEADDLTRRGIERARSAASQVREQAVHAGDITVDRIKADPVKAVLIAAAAGAAAALIVQWLASRRPAP